MNDHKKLDRLLELRRHEEQRSILDLAMARRTVLDAEETLRQLEAQRQALEADLDEIRGGSIGEVKTLRLLIEQVDNSVRNARTILAAAQATEREKVDSMTVAAKDRDALERVVEPRHQQAREMERMKEQKQSDELAAIRFRRQGSSS